MKTLLTLRSGDKVTIFNGEHVITYTLRHNYSKKPGTLLIGSPLHLFIENLGLGIKPIKKHHTIKISERSRYFKPYEVLEIERKTPWYITILRFIRSLRKKLKV